MSFQKFKTDSYCVGGRHRSSTKNIHGDMTSKCSKVLIGSCSVCNRKKSMTVSDNTIKAEGVGSFFKKLGKILQKQVKNQQLMHSKLQLDSLKSVLTLLRQRQVEILKQPYQHYQK